MKKLAIALFIAVTVIASPLSASDFCAGWYDGYAQGVCHNKPGCAPPAPPACPAPAPLQNSYQDGFARGFMAGLNSR